MITTSQVLTDPKVQHAWMEVEAATRRYSQAVLDAVLDPQPVGDPLMYGRVVDVTVEPDDDPSYPDRVTLTVLVDRGAVSWSGSLPATPVVVARTRRPTPFPPPKAADDG